MNAPVARRGRRLAFVLVIVLAASVYAVVHRDGEQARAQSGAVPLAVQPQIGPVRGVSMLGSASQGTSGDPAEAWGYGSGSSYAALDGQPLEQAGFRLMRFLSAEGWRAVETPVDEQNRPYLGVPVQRESGRVTARGGLVLVTTDSSRPAGEQRVVLARDRGGRTHALPAADQTILFPRAGSLPAELFSGTVLAADDQGDRTLAYLAIEGRTPQTAVGRWDGTAWAREPLCVIAAAGDPPPPACNAGETLTGPSLTAVAITAAGGGAWMLARQTGRGLVLFERIEAGGTVRWRLRSTGIAAFDDAATPAQNVSDVAPLESPFAATATPDGVWLDGRFRDRGTARNVTLFFDGTVGTAWCDVAALCAHELNAVLSRAQRSFAWGRPGAGSRIITGADRVGGASPQGGLQYLRLDGDRFTREQSFSSPSGPGSGTAAFGAPDEGWIGSARITRGAWVAPLANWPLPVRRPLTAIDTAPGRAAGDIGAGALAVGMDGTVLRYQAGQGWDSEPLLGASGLAHPNLRGVAWPSDEFAFAVGDNGAMWRWRRATGLWESDPGAPFDFVGQLTGVAFQPGNPERGYAVGRGGVLLRYDKSWTQETLPDAVMTSGPLGGPADLMSVAFSGSQALVAAWNALLVNDGTGWRVDEQAQALLAGARVYAVAGLPDGGAVAAGEGPVLIRDAAGAPWRLADQSLTDQVITAVAAFREGDRVRALASVVRGANAWPRGPEYELAPNEPGAPPPRPLSFTLPTEGILLRETATGWRDEQRATFVAPGTDGTRRPDPVLALLVGPGGSGWTVGGFSGQIELQDGIGAFPHTQTASAARYAPSGPEQPPGQRAALPPMAAGPARLVAGGWAQCDEPCAGLEQLQLMPERTLAQAAAQANAMASAQNGPRAMLYTGGRIAPLAGGSDPEPAVEATRLAQLLSGGPSPVLAAVAPGDAGAGTTAAFQSAFATAAAPFGAGPAAPGTAPVEIGAPAAPGRARTHYAADIQTSGGQVRVIVIDNARGSLAASDPHQNPPEPQAPWLQQVLADARTRGLPTIVMGHLSLNEREEGEATDAVEVGELLRSGGASAYVFASPAIQRATVVPAGAADAIPAFGSGSLGYRSQLPDQGFGGPGLLMLEVDAARRDPGTNRAPVATRLIPVIEDLAIEAVDGRILNRSQPALFRGLGRRPRSGDRLVVGTAGSDPYVSLPAEPCAGGGCAGRIDPEVRFTSSDPYIADFVRLDPASDNPRKPAIDPTNDKPIPDARSGLLCAFNAGTTTVTIESGGLAYSTTVTVRDGTVLRPCGTIPIPPDKFPPAEDPPQVDDPPPPPPDAAPEEDLPIIPPPPPPPPPDQESEQEPEQSEPEREQRPQPPFTPVSDPPSPGLTVLVPLPPPPVPRPIPPSGTSPVSSSTTVVQPATKVQKEREEEAAPEHQNAAVRYDPGAAERQVLAGVVLVAVFGMALAVVGLRQAPRRRDRGAELARAYVDTSPQRHRRSW